MQTRQKEGTRSIGIALFLYLTQQLIEQKKIAVTDAYSFLLCRQDKGKVSVFRVEVRSSTALGELTRQLVYFRASCQKPAGPGRPFSHSNRLFSMG
jgi:hypothetical protein